MKKIKFLLLLIVPVIFFSCFDVSAKEVSVSGDYGVYQAQYKNRNGTITIISSSQYVSSNNVVGDGTAYTWFSARESLITPTITQYNYYVMPEFRVFANANFKAGSFYTLNCQWGAGGEVQKTFQNGLLSSSVGGLMSGASDYDTTVVSNVSVSYSDQYFTVTFKALQDFNSVRFRFGNQELISNNQYTTLLLSNNSDYQQGFRIYVLNLVEADDLNSALLGQITNQNSTIINQNQQIIDSQGKTNDILEDDDVSGANSEASSFFNDFTTTDHGSISSVVKAPLVAFNSMLSNQCTPLTTTWKGQQISLPCGTDFWSQLGELKTFINLTYGGILCYTIAVTLFKLINRLKNPDDDKVEVMDL